MIIFNLFLNIKQAYIFFLNSNILRFKLGLNNNDIMFTQKYYLIFLFILCKPFLLFYLFIPSKLKTYQVFFYYD